MGKTDQIFIILIIIALFTIFYLSFNSMKSVKESFIGFDINFQSGISPITPTGTIKFEKPFIQTPSIFTQIIGDSSISEIAYSIQIFNITNTSFDYSKKKIYNEKKDNFEAVRFENSILEKFNWIAISV